MGKTIGSFAKVRIVSQLFKGDYLNERAHELDKLGILPGHSLIDKLCRHVNIIHVKFGNHGFQSEVLYLPEKFGHARLVQRRIAPDRSVRYR